MVATKLQTNKLEAAQKAIKAALVRGFLLETAAARVFFTQLVTKHEYEEAPKWMGVDTACTNGKIVRYSPDFIVGLTHAELVGVLAHEALHAGLGHQARRGSREPVLWNFAADLEINPLLIEAGYTLPKCGILPKDFGFPTGLTAERYYDLLVQNSGNGQGNAQKSDKPSKASSKPSDASDAKDGAEGSGDAQSKPDNAREAPKDVGGCGGVIDAGDESQKAASKSEWEVTVSNARQLAKGRGTLPGRLAQVVDDLLTPKVDWRDVVSDFVTRSVFNRDDYTWRRPNRRFISSGMYMPGYHGEEVGHLVVAVDTSGSVFHRAKEFASELSGLLRVEPTKVTVIVCDSRVHAVQEWQPGQSFKLDVKGGGGTSHVPVWEHIAKMDEEPVAVICLTDGITSFGKDPGIPVLWVLTEECEPPFGRKVLMKGDDK